MFYIEMSLLDVIKSSSDELTYTQQKALEDAIEYYAYERKAGLSMRDAMNAAKNYLQERLHTEEAHKLDKVTQPQQTLPALLKRLPDAS